MSEQIARVLCEGEIEKLQKTPAEALRRPDKVEEVLSVSPRRERVTVPSAEEARRTQPEVEYPKPSLPSATIINPIDGAEMVLIPAGEFIMGTSDEQINQLLRQFPSWERKWFDREQPQHRVYLDDFYIDKYPVTRSLNSL